MCAKLTDRLRSSYTRAPDSVRSLAGQALALAPQSILLGGAYRRCRVAVARSRTDEAFTRVAQGNALARLLAAALRSPFYQGRLSIDVDHVLADLENVPELPITTQPEVRDHGAEMLVEPLASVDTVTTGGTSGTPLTLFQEKDRGAREWAFVTDLWSRGGYHLGARRAVLRGVRISHVDDKPWSWDPGLRELRLSPFHLNPQAMDTYLALLERYRIEFLHGYPSALAILAAHATQRCWKPPRRLIGVLPVSEQLFEYQRSAMRAGFGPVSVVPFYGLSEKVAIAGEVRGNPGVYEFEPLYGLTELVDDRGARVTGVGRRGRIVSTGLLLRAMPLLRYDTGDTAELVSLPQASNCHRLRVRDIRPRRGQEFLVRSDGGLVSMAALNLHSPEYAAVREFQFHQEEAGEAVLRVVLRSHTESDSTGGLVVQLQEKVGSGIRFRVEVVDALPSTPRGKRLFIDQRLALDHLDGVSGRWAGPVDTR